MTPILRSAIIEDIPQIHSLYQGVASNDLKKTTTWLAFLMLAFSVRFLRKIKYKSKP